MKQHEIKQHAENLLEHWQSIDNSEDCIPLLMRGLLTVHNKRDGYTGIMLCMYLIGNHKFCLLLHRILFLESSKRSSRLLSVIETIVRSEVEKVELKHNYILH